VTPIELQHLVNEAGRHFAGGRAEHDGDDGAAGEDVDVDSATMPARWA
jgi:hypothetical protein